MACSSRLFQARGVATEKPRSPDLSLLRGSMMQWLSAERKRLDVGGWWHYNQDSKWCYTCTCTLNSGYTGTTDPKGIKQADVVMLGFPFLWEMPDDVRTHDLAWYETVTNRNGPAMTWGIHAIGWLDLKNYAKAEEMFRKSYQSYTRAPFNVRNFAC